MTEAQAMTGELVVLLGGNEIGRLRADAKKRLSFVYGDAWRNAKGAYPLSLSLPLAKAEHGTEQVEAFLWGLLPDNEQILENWAKRFKVSARNVFALISHVGEDCAGAVQFVTPERLSAIKSGDDDKVTWLDEKNIADRLRILREDHSAWRLARDTGQFSLAGAQPKTALLCENGRWGIPGGRIPTTHILKPPTGQFDGHAENEHVCLALARSTGLPVARSEVLRFADEIAISLTRYDRQQHGNSIERVHQEDICQALGYPPTRKYQNEHGPSPLQIVELLRAQSASPATDVETFVTALAFNWLIAGTDAHAKNYSLLIAAGPRVRLAPLYDIASVLPYDQFDRHKVKLSMKIGDEYGLKQIGPRQWQKFARDIRFNADQMFEMLEEMTARLPDEIVTMAKHARREGLKHAIIDRLSKRLTDRIKECAKLLSLRTR